MQTDSQKRRRAQWLDICRNNTLRVLSVSLSLGVLLLCTGRYLWIFLVPKGEGDFELDLDPSRPESEDVGFLVAFLILALRHCCSIWSVIPIPQGIDLVMQLSEMGVVLWFLTHDLPELLTSSAGDQTVAAQRFILLFLYLPTAFFHAAWKFEDTSYSQQNLFDAMKSPSQLLHPDSWVRDPRIDRTGPRIFFSKAVVVLTAVKLAIMIVTGDVAILVAAIIISATIIIHHLLSFFITPILPQAVDFALLILEFLIVGNSDDYTPVIVLAIFQRIALFFLLHYRTWDIVTNIRAPLQRFNLVPSYPRDGSRLALILGRRAWVDMSLKGEPAGVKAVRAALAIAFVAAIILFSAILISRGMASSRDEVALKYFNLQESSGTLSSIGHAVLLGPSERARRTFSVVLDNPNILQVTQTCDNETTPAPCTRCENASPPTEFIFSYLCWTCKPSLPNAPAFQSFVEVGCEVQIKADFGLAAQLGAIAGAERFNAFHIRLAGTNLEPEVGERLPYSVLRRNEGVRGDAVFHDREILKPSRFTSFGFGPTKTIFVGEIKHISPDFFYKVPNTTSYLTYQYFPNTSPVNTLVRETSDSTILDALSGIGGIWTFGNGVFALVFGGSLLYFLLGIRPLSRFGFIHIFLLSQLREATKREYPNFHREGGQPGDPEAGVIAFVRQHLLGVVEDHEDDNDWKQTKDTVDMERGDQSEFLEMDSLETHSLRGGEERRRNV